MFTERDVYLTQQLPKGLLRGMYEIKRFRLAFCLEAPEELRVRHFPELASRMEAEAVRGTFDFLPCPPSFFSRTVTGYGC